MQSRSLDERTWRNWQTRRFQVPVGDHGGSSPFVRTKQIEVPCGTSICIYDYTKGREGGGASASERFAVEWCGYSLIAANRTARCAVRWGAPPKARVPSSAPSE